MSWEEIRHPSKRRQRRRVAHKAREAARARAETRRGINGCPTPDKPAYDLSDPDEARLAERRGGPGRRLYECRCGFSHHTTAD